MRARLILGLVAVLALAVLVIVVLQRLRDDPIPVVVVPGYGGGGGMVEDITARLRAEDLVVEAVTLPFFGTGEIEVSAAALEQGIAELGADQIDLVAFSAGGIVARYYVKFLGGDERIRNLVMLGVPNHGAEFAGFVAGQSRLCIGSCPQLVPGSDLLERLNAGDETPGDISYTSIFSDLDQIVRPPESAALQGAVNIRLQDICAGNTSDHGGLLDEPLPMGLVVQALTGSLTDPPGSDRCGLLRDLGRPRPSPT